MRRPSQARSCSAACDRRCNSRPALPPTPSLAATHADRTWKRAHGTYILPLPSVPQVIETRVLGLNAFLQMVLSSPTYATSTDLVDFLERERNLPPPGLDLILDPHDAPESSSAEGTAEGTRQAMMKRLMEAASHAFISVSQEPPALDARYLNDRAALYASTLRPAKGPPAGSTLPLKPAPKTARPSAAAIEEAMQRLLLAPPTNPEETALVKATAESAAAALAGMAIPQGKYQVICVMSQAS